MNFVISSSSYGSVLACLDFSGVEVKRSKNSCGIKNTSKETEARMGLLLTPACKFARRLQWVWVLSVLQVHSTALCPRLVITECVVHVCVYYVL